MKPSPIRTLYFALIALWLGVSGAVAAAEPKREYGGFSSDSLQVFYDYIHGQEMIKVEAGLQLRSAIEAIPIELGTAIDLKQETNLRDWLYDFLVAFSSSGSDSLAATFYLREGVNNPNMLEQVKNEAESQGILKGDIDTPFAFFKSMHKIALEFAERDYFFENVSFFDSVFKVFEMQEEYDSYEAYLETHGMLPKGMVFFDLKLQEKIEKHLQGGIPLVFADVMFIVEEPEGISNWSWQGRTPSFFRLVWDPERAMWCHVEVYFSHGVPHNFLLFNIM